MQPRTHQGFSNALPFLSLELGFFLLRGSMALPKEVHAPFTCFHLRHGFGGGVPLLPAGLPHRFVVGVQLQ